MLKIGALVSGGGTNLQAIIDGIENGYIPNAKLTTVVSSSPSAYALERAAKHGIETAVIRKKDYETPDGYEEALVSHFTGCGVGLVLMAGFMVVIGEKFINAYRDRIMNIHPSLIPSFCGNGFYGLRVHEAALKKGVKITGATVHFVTEETDAGPIILQKAVNIHDDDTPETLQKRVMQEAEWKIYPEAVRLFASGEIEIAGNTVRRKNK